MKTTQNTELRERHRTRRTLSCHKSFEVMKDFLASNVCDYVAYLLTMPFACSVLSEPNAMEAKLSPFLVFSVSLCFVTVKSITSLGWHLQQMWCDSLQMPGYRMNLGLCVCVCADVQMCVQESGGSVGVLLCMNHGCPRMIFCVLEIIMISPRGASSKLKLRFALNIECYTLYSESTETAQLGRGWCSSLVNIIVRHYGQICSDDQGTYRCVFLPIKKIVIVS